MNTLTAGEVIERLDLEPHPEGGHYRETWRADAPARDRSAGTAIYFLLDTGETSHWHRIDAAEIWHWYAGGPLDLSIADPQERITAHRLGPDLAAGERPQAIVPAMAWQSARAVAGWVLVGCTVSPAFQFETFDLAAPGWAPGK